MKVYPANNKQGKPVSFEVDNTFLGRRGAVRVISKIPGVELIRRPKKLFSWFRESEFCEFKLNGQRFIIEEPFGDNSRYWVAAAPSAKACNEVEVIISQFEQQKWPLGI